MSLHIGAPDIDPQNNVATLVNRAESSSFKTYRSTAGYLNFERWGYVMVVCVKDNPAYSPHEYLILTKKKGTIIVESTHGPGPENARRLTNKEAQSYIHKLGIPLDKLNELHWIRFATM